MLVIPRSGEPSHLSVRENKIEPDSWPRASVIIVNTNERNHLQVCLPSVFAQDYPDYEVIISDNCSNDGSLEYIAQNFPQAVIIRNPKNLGYTGANNVGFERASGEYVAVLNPDTRVKPGWLRALVSALEHEPNAGLATPKILLMDNPGKINTCGNDITFTGLTFCRGLEEPSENYPLAQEVSAVSGAAFVIRKSVLEEIGGFDEHLFIYYEETELSLRASLAGYICLYVPEAIIFHKYAFQYSPQKSFYQERNRYFALLKTLKWRTLLVLLPTLLIGEVIAWGYAFSKSPRHILAKLRTYAWLVRNWKLVLEVRQTNQKLRRVTDKAILGRFGHRINFTQTAPTWLVPWLRKIVNPVLVIISKFCYRLVFW